MELANSCSSSLSHSRRGTIDDDDTTASPIPLSFPSYPCSSFATRPSPPPHPQPYQSPYNYHPTSAPQPSLLPANPPVSSSEGRTPPCTQVPTPRAAARLIPHLTPLHAIRRTLAGNKAAAQRPPNRKARRDRHPACLPLRNCSCAGERRALPARAVRVANGVAVSGLSADGGPGRRAGLRGREIGSYVRGERVWDLGVGAWLLLADAWAWR